VGLYTFAYDAEGRMTSAVLANAQATMYLYDGNGQRVAKVVCPSGGGTCTTATPNATVNWYVYDAQGQLAAEYDGGTATPPCTTCYVMVDQLGSTRVVTDQNGVAQECSDYLPFGEALYSGDNGRSGCYPSSDTAGLKFTGQMRGASYEGGPSSQGPGLDYFGARYFSGAQGRFTSVDPTLASAKSSNPQSWNRYTYALNNPLRYVDPDG
jgi:RHS repeat-associated protein